MRTLWRRVALRFGIAGLCLGAAIAFAASRLASQTGDVLAPADGVSARNSADVTGSSGESASARSLPLSEEQRGHIFDGIMRIHDAPTADVAVPEFVTALPSSVALQELPVNVTRENPLLQGYKFVKLEDRILLVSPVDRSVVAQMPRYRTLLD
jgi:Protein of unknown function (DUF1236)